MAQGNATSVFNNLIASKSIIGIDIGISSIKVCEMSKGVGGGYTLIGFASEVLSEAAIIEDEIQKIEEITEVIASLLKRLGTKSRHFCLGLQGPRTMTKRFEIPDGSKDEVEDNILWEAEQYITFGSDHAEISHQEIEKKDNGNVDVLIAAVNIDMAKSFISAAESTGLKVKIVDLGVLALSNIFEVIKKGDKALLSKTNLIIDFGAQSTKMVLYKDNAPLLTKEVNIGSVLATEEIQRVMGVSYFEAEDLKMSIDEDGNLPEEVKEIIWRVNERIIDEIKKTINFFNSTSGGEKIHQIFVTGGGSLVEGILDVLQEETTVDTTYLEPFEKIKITGKMSDEEIDLIARTGCVVMGLGIRSSK